MALWRLRGVRNSGFRSFVLFRIVIPGRDGTSWPIPCVRSRGFAVLVADDQSIGTVRGTRDRGPFDERGRGHHDGDQYSDQNRKVHRREFFRLATKLKKLYLTWEFGSPEPSPTFQTPIPSGHWIDEKTVVVIVICLIIISTRNNWDENNNCCSDL